MTTEQEKALKICQGIEAEASGIYGKILSLEFALEDESGSKARRMRTELEALQSHHNYLERLVGQIESEFGVGYECIATCEYEQPSSEIQGVTYKTEQKTMKRVDGKIKYDFKIKLAGGFNIFQAPDEQGIKAIFTRTSL